MSMPSGEREQSLGDSLREPGGRLGEVVFEAHLALRGWRTPTRSRGGCGPWRLLGRAAGRALWPSGVWISTPCRRSVSAYSRPQRPLSAIRVLPGCAVASSRTGSYSLLVGGRRGRSRPAAPRRSVINTRRMPQYALALGGAVAVGGVAGELAAARAAGVVGDTDQGAVDEAARCPWRAARRRRSWTVVICGVSRRRRRLYCDWSGRWGNQPGSSRRSAPRNWRSEDIARRPPGRPPARSARRR